MSHDHDHELADWRNRETRKAGLIGAVTNLVLSITKIVAGYYGQSQALIVDGIHSLSDLLSDALILFASHHASQKPDSDHPYGHGRFETAATLALGILLILVSVGIAWDGIERLLQEEERTTPAMITLYAAAFSILANELLYWYTLIVAKKIKSEMLRANAWHHRSDAVSSIVVFVGIVGAQLGVASLDTVAALVVGFMIARIGWSLGWKAVQELVDTSLEDDQVLRVRDVISNVHGVRSIHMLRTRKSGHQSSADVHILVEPWLSVSEGHMISVAVEQQLKEKIDHMADVTVHIDPEDDEEAPPCKDLPLRNEALQILEKSWKDIDCFANVEKILLHYLSGKIAVDLVFPMECYVSSENAGKMRKIFNQQLTDCRFSETNLFFSAPK